MTALDEVHELRNGNDRLGAAMMIAERSQVVLGLTATPIVGGVKVSFSPPL
jgi:superfamily II DNA or RNA helicase